MICRKCGTNVPDGAPACHVCGTPMGYAAPVPASVPGKGLGIAGMVLGIVSLVFFCIWYISLPCGITGIILSAVSKSKAKPYGAKSGLATAGIVCSAIALGLMILFIILVAIGIAEMGLL